MNKLSKLIFFGIFIAGGCTAYQPQGLSGGYTETWLTNDIVKVRFNGNGYTTAERTTDFSLLRLTEIGKEKGYPYFILISGGTDYSSFTTPNSYQISNYGSYSTVQQTGGVTITKPSSENTARFLKEKPKNYFGIVYERDIVCRSIAQKYEITTAVCD